MPVAEIVAIAVAVVSLLFAAYCYRNTRRWVTAGYQGRIAIAYNRRVQLDAPLIEWMQWAQQLRKDDESRGRVIYRNGKMSVSLLRPRPVGRARAKWLQARRIWRERRTPERERQQARVRSTKVGA